MYDYHILKNVFLTILATFLTNVSYTMVRSPYFEEVYLNVSNQSGCFCEMSFLKTGLFCIEARGTGSNGMVY